jgi:hypothetical protein
MAIIPYFAETEVIHFGLHLQGGEIRSAEAEIILGIDLRGIDPRSPIGIDHMEHIAYIDVIINPFTDRPACVAYSVCCHVASWVWVVG